MIKATAWFNKESVLYFFAAMTSVLLSCWLDYNDVVINRDGICYLLSAQIVGTSTIKEIMQFCPQSQWPFYSILINAMVQISHLSYPISAYLLNGCFTLLSVILFMLIIKELRGKGAVRILWLAAFVILFNHQFNILREDIIRDHGFWAFYLGSIFFLLRFFKQPKGPSALWPTALAWNGCLIIATLFRVEGAIFLLILPFIVWLRFSLSLKERATSFMALIMPMLLICLSILIWQGFHAGSSLEKLGRIGEIVHQLQHGLVMLFERYQATKAALVQYVLPPDASSDASVVLLLVFIGWYLYNVCITLSFGYVALVLYAWKAKAYTWAKPSALVVWSYVLINLMVTLGFLVQHLFISKRYLIALTLTLMLWVPFALEDLIQKWQSMRHRWFLAMMAFVLFISSLSGIIEFGYSKFYIRSGGDWVAAHVPADSSLYVNDIQLMYYTQHFGTQLFELPKERLSIQTIAQGKWKQYDYLALRLLNKEEGETAAVLQEMAGIKPIQVFKNKRGHHVAIYKINNTNNTNNINKIHEKQSHDRGESQ